MYLPIEAENRLDIAEVRLTKIGRFGIPRGSRPGIPAHLHTGVDIVRPYPDYEYVPVFPAAPGKIISLRNDGPFAQIIIEHPWRDNETIWTVYEHIAGINSSLGEWVDQDIPIARFMNREELDRYGWQFDHIHFEVMKRPPVQAEPTDELPDRFYYSHWLDCVDSSELHAMYYGPLNFIENRRSLGRHPKSKY